MTAGDVSTEEGGRPGEASGDPLPFKTSAFPFPFPSFLPRAHTRTGRPASRASRRTTYMRCFVFHPSTPLGTLALRQGPDLIVPSIPPDTLPLRQGPDLIVPSIPPGTPLRQGPDLIVPTLALRQGPDLITPIPPGTLLLRQGPDPIVPILAL
ncbi:hypothetical protein J6590_081819 [Homalodisca vitripennis]|nr:hypothetical protein J6590_081819 [Homalodisca vitripennis]